MSARSIRFHGGARRELRRTVDRYDEQLHGLGDEFAAEIEHAVRLIATHPESGSLHYLGTRRIQVERFPYSLVHTERDQQLVILAVAHHRRTPEYRIRRI